MTSSTRLKFAILALLIAGTVIALKVAHVDLRHFTPEHVHNRIRSFGPWAPAVYFLIYGQPIVPLPASVMILAGGLAFGPVKGTLLALVSATCRACGQFGIARLLGRDTVEKLLRGKAAAFDAQIAENGFRTVLLVRLIPNLPLDMQNYAFGFSRVRFVPYAVATFLGLAPGAFAYVYLGYSLVDRTQLWKFGLAMLIIVGMFVWQHTTKRKQPPLDGPRA